MYKQEVLVTELLAQINHRIHLDAPLAKIYNRSHGESVLNSIRKGDSYDS